MKKLRLSIFFLFVTSVSFAQSKELSKAVKAGKNTSSNYRAAFKNLDLKKEQSIRKWCDDHDYMLVSISKDSKERFGGNIHTFITGAEFSTKHDYYFKKAIKSYSANSTENLTYFIDNFKTSPKVETVFDRLLSASNTIRQCSKFYQKYPSHQVEFHQKAFDIADKGSLKVKEEFVNLFAFSEHAPKIQNDIDEEIRIREERKRLAAEEARRQAELKTKRDAEKRARREAQLAAEAEAKRVSNLRKYETLRNSVGKKVYWTEKETYKTGSSGSVLGDMVFGSLYKTTYVIEYLAIVEKVLGDNVKVTIIDVGIKDPKFVSINYIDSKGHVLNKAQNRIGQTRVKSFDDIEDYDR